nr:cytochrome P450 76M5-like [Aegilops tauschii subsp. strangulata]
MWFSALLACIAVTTLITIHVVHILHKHTRRKSVSPPRPPGPAGHPILGNLLYVIGPLRNNPHTALATLAQTYGPILSLRLGLTRTIVVVSSAAAAHEALAKNDAALASRLVPDTVHAMSYGATSMVFLPSSNPLWKQDRVIMAPASHPAGAWTRSGPSWNAMSGVSPST